MEDDRNTSPEVLLKLLRIALGNETDFSLPAVTDWQSVVDLAFAQSVAAISADGMQKVYDSDPDGQVGPEMEDLKYEWFADAMVCEHTYRRHIRVISRLSAFYASRGIPMMVLKGYGLSLNYPIPSHRQTGDIDIYLWNFWEHADRHLTSTLGIPIDNSHHHHSVFSFNGLSVENHYDFVNVHSHRSNRKIEVTFKKLAEDKSFEHTLPDGSKIFFPSPDLNAAFLAFHCAAHFAADSINLRQLLDWALFVSNHHTEVDWDFFWGFAEEVGMVQFVLAVNSIACSCLGFEPSVFCHPKKYSVSPELVDKVLGDILRPTGSKDGGCYILRRFDNWWRNRWKHRIVYRDSLFSTFLSQVYSHLLKPASLRRGVGV